MSQSALAGMRELAMLGIIGGAAPSGFRAGPIRPSQHSPFAYGPNWRQSGMQTVVFYLVIGVSFGGLIIGLLYWIYSLIRGSAEDE